MRVSIFAGLTAIGLFGAFAANAEEIAITSHSAETIALTDPDKVICAYTYHEGQLIRRPICRTAQSWANERDRTRRELLEWQVRHLSNRGR